MGVLEYIPENIKLDEAQLSLISELDLIRDDWSKFRIIKKPKYLGVYLYGPVGRGKTVILKAFFDSIEKKKTYYHYHEFISIIHKEAHKSFRYGIAEGVEYIASEMAKKNKVIFIDELEIRDITDAMLIKRLTDFFLNKGVFLLITSNIKPSNLYNDSFYGEQFKPCIHMIEKYYFNYNLDNAIDYRFTKVSSGKNVIIQGTSFEDIINFQELENTLTHNKHYTNKSFYLLGRKVFFEKFYEGVLKTNLKEIAERDLSYNDFLTIAEEVQVVIFTADQPLEDNSDQIIRFINFIDNLYAAKVMLVAKFSFPVSELYKYKKYQKEFSRAVSRIAEMNGIDYIDQSKYYRKNDE